LSRAAAAVRSNRESGLVRERAPSSARPYDRVKTQFASRAFGLAARFLIFDRVKREYLGERRCRREAVRARPGEWLEERISVSSDGGELFQREKSIFMRDLL
jgi:hypothetical protein